MVKLSSSPLWLCCYQSSSAGLRLTQTLLACVQGDLCMSLMEVARDELAKPAKDISRARLASLLEMGELAAVREHAALCSHGQSVPYPKP